MKVETPVLKRLGPVPFWRGEKKCLDELQRIYNRAADFATEKLGRSLSGRSSMNRRGSGGVSTCV